MVPTTSSPPNVEQSSPLFVRARNSTEDPTLVMPSVWLSGALHVAPA